MASIPTRTLGRGLSSSSSSSSSLLVSSQTASSAFKLSRPQFQPTPPPDDARTFSTTAPSSNLPSESNSFPPRKAITIDSINQFLRQADYAVRGRLAIRAEELRDRLEAGDTSLPFKKIINANIGNPQAMEQKPITFFRQVLSLVQYPELLNNEYTPRIFPSDAIQRASTLLKEIGSVGSYSQSQGVPYIRRSIANYINERDGFSSDPKDIYLAAGASSAVSYLLTTICQGPNTGVMIPVPQYPLYSATLTISNATPVPYELNEETQWGTDTKYIARVVKQSQIEGVKLKAMVVINPCNPTGSCLTRDEISDIITLAAKETFLIIADEVYQTNVYTGEFHSFKKILRELQRDYPGIYDHVELASLHSTSKGMVGECGQRGGYMELIGFDDDVLEQLYKLVSISLCPVVTGQVLTEVMVNPPKPGDESYPLYEQEYNTIYNNLRNRALRLFNAFQTMEGVSCQQPQGAMYLFPTISLPLNAIKEARRRNQEPDEFYCLQLLEETGVCVVPGSGFGQKDGTYHFRTTFLSPGDDYVQSIINFHNRFLEKFV
ncbi:pyridoxal phosphate-dependent transferase [Lipomyces japonicus]|uniref:pyridoxal phosphate-dependent transferase n=1 Tax=Lipomyces japonicus TaxID=56871 RepID=UPI0034CDB4A9